MSMTGKMQRMIAQGDPDILATTINATVPLTPNFLRRIACGDKQSVDAVLGLAGTGPISQSMDEDDWPILAQNLIGRV